MNHLRARQVDPNGSTPDAGKWRYTTSSRHGHTYAIGYCSRITDCPVTDCHLGQVYDPETGMRDCTVCGSRGVVDCDEPCPGHDTPTEAEEHYRQYLLDARLRFYADPNNDVMRRCVAPTDAGTCGDWTTGSAVLDGWHAWALCEAHRTRTIIDGLFPTVGDSWES